MSQHIAVSGHWMLGRQREELLATKQVQTRRELTQTRRLSFYVEERAAGARDGQVQNRGNGRTPDSQGPRGGIHLVVLAGKQKRGDHG